MRTVGELARHLGTSIPTVYEDLPIALPHGSHKLDPKGSKTAKEMLTVFLPADQYYHSGYGNEFGDFVVHIAWCLLEAHRTGAIFVLDARKNLAALRRRA